MRVILLNLTYSSHDIIKLEYKSLEGKLHSVQQDLQQWTNKFNDLQKTLETERSAWANDKKTLEDTIVDMTTSERHSESDRATHEREVRTLEARAVVCVYSQSKHMFCLRSSIGCRRQVFARSGCACGLVQGDREPEATTWERAGYVAPASSRGNQCPNQTRGFRRQLEAAKGGIG